MRLQVIAVGTRMPAWVRAACDDYLRRLSSALPITLTQIEPGVRTARGSAQTAIATEGRRVLGALTPADHVVVLDERGRELTTRELAGWLNTRQQAGQDLAFIIGGPDGLANEVRSRGNFTLALSRLTLPHALVRVLLIEQLYRAHCILVNHPYHRD
jgi:23S rRNA (pseudouridine1915-N3)-methyltransferase